MYLIGTVTNITGLLQQILPIGGLVYTKRIMDGFRILFFKKNHKKTRGFLPLAG